MVSEQSASIKPALGAILWNDWPALVGWIGIPIVWALFATRGFLQLLRQPDTVWLAGVVASSVGLAVLLVWRIVRVHRLFARGVPAPGRITALTLVKGRGRLEFTYEAAGQPWHDWTPVTRTPHVLGLTPGREVRVLVDPRKPRRAIVAELYAAALPPAADLSAQLTDHEDTTS